jgi:hypothetical protein
MIYLDHWQEQRPKVVNKQPVKDATGNAVMEDYEYHIAYCRQCRVERWDSLALAKNRYGLPAAMNITDKSFYRLLLGKLKEAQEKAAKDKVEAAKATAATTNAVPVPVTGATPTAVAVPVAVTKSTTTKTITTKDDKENTK